MRLSVGSLALAATTVTATALGIQTAPLILPRLGADAKSVRFERQ